MRTAYEKFMALPIDKGLLCLEPGDITQPYYCYPVNAEPVGFEGCILYCFLPEYGEMVFACNPERCADQNVYPLAANFEDFIRLILACGTVNPVEQIVWMTGTVQQACGKGKEDSYRRTESGCEDASAGIRISPDERPI